MSEALHCAIYKSPRKLDMYLYVREKDRLDEVPKTLLETFGKPEFVMELDLSPARPLARAEVSEVMAHLRERGFYLQMPPNQLDV